MPVMVSRLRPLLLAACAAVLSCTTACAQGTPVTLTLAGIDGGGRTLTFAQLDSLPQTEVTVDDKDSGTIVFRGPALRSLMTLAGAPQGHDLRGPNLLLAILAEAADGYKVAYMLADIDPQFGARTAIVALTQNGRPLPAN